ncbi:unnamed protein product [Arabis nemorensis]|uniref:F-box domain-containing protein n=1 Tax=Arabis nemorensis TaxID=586526 RepID=A0A565AWY7_9BRAS|nr:unnamed protein product [Arabis nemorensis]
MEDKEEEHNKNKDPIRIDLIPLDLTIEILTRLPVKSLLRFQYVSKTWCSIIRSKDFINSSVSMSSMPSSQILISFKNGTLTNKNPENCLFFITSSQEDEESSSLVTNLDMKLTSVEAYFHTRCASVNGFICISHNGRFKICNPTTGQVITLPEIKGNKWKHTYKYLGYDPVNDEYKALCKTVSNLKEEHKILTIRADRRSSWRHVEGTTLNYHPLTNTICINGFVYYGASTHLQDKSRVIVCFDVRSERLSFIIPHWWACGIEWKLTLTNYKGKLAIIDGLDFDLRVLEDVKEHRWSRTSFLLHRSWLDSLGGRGTPMYFPGINKIGEIIIAPMFLPWDLGSFYILYYNVESGKVRKVRLEGIGDDEDFGDCQVYIWPDYGGNITFL